MNALPQHYRALVALLIVTALSLFLTRWSVQGSSLARSFDRRAILWVVATTLCFLFNNFWLLLVVLAVVFIYAASKDDNPVALYLTFVLCLPPHYVSTGSIGPIENLMEFSTSRLLSVVILLPLALKSLGERLTQQPGAPRTAAQRIYRVTDTIVVIFAIYQIAMHFPYDSPTHVLRRCAMSTLDYLLPYFVISRYCTTRERILDSLGAILVSGLILSIIAAFEHFKGWLLYETIYDFWQLPPTLSAFLLRENVLRAQGPTGHALVLGHLLVICVGLSGLFLNKLSKPRALMMLAILMLGLYSTVSRGPWVAAALVLLLMGAFHPRAGRYYAALAGISVLVIGTLAMTPWAEKLVRLLPFIGTTDPDNVEYRRQLLDTTLFLVSQQPLFGSVKVLEQMENMRQGQGIIDLVNVYADVALNFGLIGLTLFVLFFLTAMGSAVRERWKLVRRERRGSWELVGFTSVALFGSMVTLAGISNFASVPLVYTAIVALLVAMSRQTR